MHIPTETHAKTHTQQQPTASASSDSASIHREGSRTGHYQHILGQNIVSTSECTHLNYNFQKGFYTFLKIQIQIMKHEQFLLISTMNGPLTPQTMAVIHPTIKLTQHTALTHFSSNIPPHKHTGKPHTVQTDSTLC